ncbi:MAG: hypothetical protein ABFQ62_02870 [Patescibacteria group bacterium]
MSKAKSRLKLRQSHNLRGMSRELDKKQKSSLIIRYFRHLPALLISLPFYAIVYYIFSKIKPEAIRHFLVPNAYLPLQVPLFIANFFFFSFVFLKSRRGFFISLIISLTLFLKLQGVLTALIFLIILIPILLFELVATIIDR